MKSPKRKQTPPGSGPVVDVSKVVPEVVPAPKTQMGRTSGAASSSSNSAARRFSVQALFAALVRRWRLAVCVGLVGAVLAGAATYLIVSPAHYIARTMLHVESQTPKLAFAMESRGDAVGYRQTQKTMAKSRLVLSHALEQSNIANLAMVQDAVRQKLDPVEWLEKELKVDYTAGTEILTMSLNGDYPEDLKAIVNAVRISYLEKIANKERTDRLAQLRQIEEIYNNYQDTIRSKEQALKKLAQTVGSSDVPTVMIKQQFVAERLGVTQRELIKVQGDLRTLDIKIQEMQSPREGNEVTTVPETVLEEWLRKHPLVARQRQDVAQLEEDLEKAKQVATEKTLLSYRQKLDAARTKLASIESDLRPKAIESLRDEVKRRSKASLAENLEQQTFLKKLESSLVSEIKQLEKQSEILNQGSVEVEVLRRAVADVEVVAKKLGEQKEALRVELEAPPRVQVLEDAVVSRTFNERKQLLAAAAAAAAALFFSSYVVAAWEYRAQRILSADDVVSGLGIQLLGTIPHMATPEKHWPVETHLLPNEFPKPMHLLTEAADAMRAMLVQSTNAQDPRVIVVTSAVAGEGKTALSCHLAISLSRAGHRTVLVDSDLRRPAVHRVFGLTQGPGLQEALCSGRSLRSLEDVLRDSSIDSLSVITAGSSTSHPAQLLTSDKLGAVIAQLRRQFDYVVVDSCPVLPVADTLMVGEHADGVIMAVLRGRSCLPQTQAAYLKMSTLGMHIIGGVLNGAMSGIYDYDYQYQSHSRPDDRVPGKLAGEKWTG